MTPKDKAKSLVDTFISLGMPCDCLEYSCVCFDVPIYKAKEMALICVDEILNANNDFIGTNIYATNIDFSTYQYWIMVGDEIKQYNYERH